MVLKKAPLANVSQAALTPGDAHRIGDEEELRKKRMQRIYLTRQAVGFIGLFQFQIAL